MLPCYILELMAINFHLKYNYIHSFFCRLQKYLLHNKTLASSNLHGIMHFLLLTWRKNQESLLHKQFSPLHLDERQPLYIFHILQANLLAVQLYPNSHSHIHQVIFQQIPMSLPNEHDSFPISLDFECQI